MRVARIGIGKKNAAEKILSFDEDVDVGNVGVFVENVDMPISSEIFAILYENKPAKQVVVDLMRRGLKDERN